MASWAFSDVTPDWKPQPRHKATAKEWTEIRARLEFAPCVATGLRHQHLHHILFKSQGGDDLAVNLAPLTNEAHERLHKRSSGWERVAAAIRNYVYADPARLLYQLNKVGQARFDERYPPLTERCPNPDCLMIKHPGACATELTDERFQTPQHVAAKFGSDFSIREDM